MITSGKSRVHITLNNEKLDKFRKMAKAEDLTLSQFISRKLSNIEDISDKFEKFLKNNRT